jgi:mercuric ion binding protein
MKQPAIRFILAVFSLLAAAGLAYGESGPVHAFIQVEGLACPFCAKGLEKHLKELDAVADVTISLKEGEAVLHFKSGRSVSEKALREAVKRAGFTAGAIRFDRQRTEKESPKAGGERP